MAAQARRGRRSRRYGTCASSALTGLGKTLAAFRGGDRCAGAGRRRPPGRDPGRRRLPAQGSLQRYPAQPGGAAGRHPRGAARAGTARRRRPRHGAHRRYAAGEREKTRRRPPHIVVTTPESLYILLVSEGPRHAEDDAHRDRGRVSTPLSRPPRRHSGAVAGAARMPGAGEQLPAHRPVRHSEADRRRRPLPGWQRRPGGGGLATAASSTSATCRAHRSRRWRCRSLAPRGGHVERGVGGGLRPPHRAD